MPVAKLLIDTGPLVALLNRDEKLHQDCVDFLKGFRGQLLSTEAILTEALYLLGDAWEFQKKCFEFVLAAVQLVPVSVNSLKQTMSLMEKYDDVPMDYADATLVVLAQELDVHEIFTLDRRGFSTYRMSRNRGFTIYPN